MQMYELIYDITNVGFEIVLQEDIKDKIREEMKNMKHSKNDMQKIKRGYNDDIIIYSILCFC